MSSSKNQPVIKHVPQRSCIACRAVRPKRELVRVVCDADGSLVVDDTGKKPGRGAYLCRRKECWDSGIKSGRLEHSLRTHIVRDSCSQLIKYAEEMWSADSREGVE